MIWLARHGQTAYNHARRFQGQLPVPLDDTGRAQAHALAAQAQLREWAVLWCSPLARARETAGIVGAAIGLEPIEDARFAETDAGDWTDRYFDDVIAQTPELFNAFATGDPDFAFPGGESFAVHRARALAGLAAVRADGRSPALIVSHGVTMRLILAHEHPDPGRLATPLPNATLIELDPWTRLAAAVFTVLALATFAAFFVAQRLKHAPTFVQQFQRAGLYLSPNNDGRAESERISFRIKHTDDVTVDIVNTRGERVRRLLADRHLVAYHQLPTLRWNGRTDGGAVAPDGTYRVRILLRGQDRSVVVPKSFRLDTVPPSPVVIGVGTKKTARRPEIVAYGAVNARITVNAPGHHRRVTIFRTDVTPAQKIDVLTIPDRARAITNVRWNGRDSAGRPAPPGVYLATIEARDPAQNRGVSPALDRKGLPITRYGHHVKGRGGIVVRDLAVAGSRFPVGAGAPVSFFVDSRQRAYTWSLRRLGGDQALASGRVGAGPHPQLTIHAPGGASGVAVLTVHADRTTVQTPFVVQGSHAGGSAAGPKGVLVVLPLITWQGRNRLDDDGDGEPDTLDAGVSVSPSRPLVGNGLPVGFEHLEAPALEYLDAHQHTYDLTTDLALAKAGPQALAGYRGVLLAGDERWITPALGTALKDFVRAGGSVASLGTDSLLRTVTLSKAGNLTRPTIRAATDLFGARIGDVVHRAVSLVNVDESPSVGLFDGTGGLFGGYRRFEPTLSLGAVLRPQTDAVDQSSGDNVIVAARYGRGLVIRFGLPDFASALTTTPQTAQMMDNTWTILSR